jgi:uncharacterized membrane protein YhiD involved in acid resistance
MHNNEFLKYAGMATQFIVTLGVAIFIGFKVDQWIGWRFPLLTILLPLTAIISLLYKIYIESNPKK